MAIHPESEKKEFATFSANEREKVRRWVDARQGKVNLYVSVNRAREHAPRNKRLSGNDVALIRAIPIDIDIKVEDPSGQHFQRLKTKLLKEVVPELAKLEWPQALIVDSGGGVHLWWPLKEPVAATPDNAKKAKGIGLTISKRLQAAFPEYKVDTVSDLPRIMRLPGTINIPNERKRKQGRLAAPATVLFDHCCDNSYSLDDLAAWVPPASDRRSNSSEKALPEIDMTLVRSVNDYNDLSAELRAKFDNARKANPPLENLWRNGPLALRQEDTSRSVQVFALGCHLMRDGGFTPTEFGQLLWVWEHGYSDEPDKIDRRLIGRAWNKADEVSASGWEPEEGRGETKKQGNEPTGAEWDEEPTDFWADQSEPPNLPDGVVPEVVERFARDRGRRFGVEAGAPAVCLVTALTSAIPASNKLQMRQRDPLWTAPPIVWTALIGDPGSNKSATVNSAIRPLNALEKKWSNEYAKEKRAFEENEKAIKEAKARGEPGPDPTPKPQWRTKILGNTTTEALAMVLSENPEGVFSPFDELSAFFGGMDTYKSSKGADRPFWIQMHEGGGYTVRRKTSDSIRIEHCAVSILGGIQPDKLKPMVPELATDGLLQRFLPVYLKRFGHGEDIDPDGDLDKIIEKLAIVLSEITVGLFKFTPEADAERRRIEDFEDMQRARCDGPKFKQWLGKLPGQFGRIALAFHWIRWASLPEQNRGESPPEMIPLEIATMARRFIEEFLFPHAREVYRSMLDQSPSEDHAIWIAEHILSRGMGSLKKREIQRSYKDLKSPDKERIGHNGHQSQAVVQR
jgi:hypothetical protein